MQPPDGQTAPIRLRAGPVVLYFDPEWAFARRFLVDGVEALRAVYAAIRTETWASVKPRLENVRVDQKARSFRVSFEAYCQQAETGVDFAWRGEVTGEVDGAITYSFEGEARAPMRTNRTGLCVLHPSGLAGQALSVEHVDGGVTKGQFPLFVSPHQPFFNIRALTHQVAAGVLAKVTVEGDTFEMEDQRNWTDASFKTYSTPLAIPRPHHFAAGHRVRQSVRFELLGRAPAYLPAKPPMVVPLPEKATFLIPSLGVRWAPDAGELTAQEWDEVRDWKLGHLFVDVDITIGGWRESLGSGLAAAERLGVKALLGVVFTPNYQPALYELAGDIASWGDRLVAVTVATPDEPSPGSITLGLVRDALDRVAPHATIAASPMANFAELNRYRPPSDFAVSVPICPQVHAFDNESLFENIEAQASVLQSIAKFNPHPIHVGPITLRRGRQADERQGTDLCAAWTLGSLCALAQENSVASLTYHEHAGINGVLGTPTSQVFAALARASGIAPVQGQSSQVAAMAAFFPHKRRGLLLANLTRDIVNLTLEHQEIGLGPFAFRAL